MNKFDDLWAYVETVKPDIERTLREHLPLAPQFINTNFNEALDYALFPGGKRLRPMLTLLGAETVGGKREKVLSAAAAIEFVHTSSLIFDDLPCMDDALERRGKSALHQKFGEGTAVLVGLALLNAAYGLVFSGLSENCFVCLTNSVRAHAEFVNCIGAAGMVGGQLVDLELAKNNSNANAHKFEGLRNLKTSALMRMSLHVGAILSGAEETELIALSKFAELLGDAYQTSDDLLDLQEDSRIFQTTTRRQTFALEKGFDKAKCRVADLIEEAKSVVEKEFGKTQPVNLLCLLADYIAEREM